MIFFLLPWLDRSPVKSIRYRGPNYKIALALFVVSFVILGWLGMQPTDFLGKLRAARWRWRRSSRASSPSCTSRSSC